METKNGPFSTYIFQQVWKKHFIPNRHVASFKCINGVTFYKSSVLPLFFNIGKNLTKGNSYNLCDYADYKNKSFVIYDVLPRLNDISNNCSKNVGIYKSTQYPGFLIDLSRFNSVEDYLLATFSKNTRMKMRKFNKRLEQCFDISSKMFFGPIDKKEYDALFVSFMDLLQKRYNDKQISYNNMQPVEWNFYKDVAYPLILEKKASLFVIYDNNVPIAITYNYHTGDTIIDAITVFDIDYAKFNIGYINNLKLLDWCFDNGINTLDFSKGYFDYKKRMCTLEYNFEYHIIYDRKSIISKFIALSYYNFLELKTYLRNKKLDVKFHKITYSIKNKKQSKPIKEVEITKLNNLPVSKDLEKIDVRNENHHNSLAKCVNDFLYLSIKPYNEIDVYKINSQDNTYIISCDSLIQHITFR